MPRNASLNHPDTGYFLCPEFLFDVCKGYPKSTFMLGTYLYGFMNKQTEDEPNRPVYVIDDDIPLLTTTTNRTFKKNLGRLTEAGVITCEDCLYNGKVGVKITLLG